MVRAKNRHQPDTSNVPTVMIPPIKLSAEEFARKYPPGGKGRTSSSTSFRESEGGDLCRHPILNDVRIAATSCLIYQYKDLKDNAGDSTFPIPETEKFEELRELKSLKAVVKQMSDGN